MKRKDLAHSTKPLIEALARYDQTAPQRSAAWMMCDTAADVAAIEARDLTALRDVQLALYQVTHGRNSLSDCLACGIDFMRRVAGMSCPD